MSVGACGANLLAIEMGWCSIQYLKPPNYVQQRMLHHPDTIKTMCDDTIKFLCVVVVCEVYVCVCVKTLKMQNLGIVVMNCMRCARELEILNTS